ncbi:LysM peptidoglycan-binding domain-containing protein [Myxococcus fulvus]|uniref:LysM peptidoglycan-binding domain-containing protein n=1 Tax=Myxococcus fulvus TaxID=33 RepID=UPI003B9C493F
MPPPPAGMHVLAAGETSTPAAAEPKPAPATDAATAPAAQPSMPDSGTATRPTGPATEPSRAGTADLAKGTKVESASTPTGSTSATTVAKGTKVEGASAPTGSTSATTVAQDTKVEGAPSAVVAPSANTTDAAKGVKAQGTSSTGVASTASKQEPVAPATEVAPGDDEADEARALAGAPEDPDEEPEATREVVESESAELEELRALESVTLDPTAKPSAEVMQSLRRLGLANPLRMRMLDALEEPTFREDDSPEQLPLITNLATFDVRSIQDRYDIPVEMQPLVAQYIQFFQGPGRRWFRKWMSRSARYLPVMQPILEKHGMPLDTVYLAMIESGFSAHAYSWAHASGPWQFISSTGKQYGLKQDFWVDERRDPLKATHAAATYLKDLYRELGHWYLAWAGYNTGSGRVRRMIERHGTRDFWALAEEKGLAKETKHYVPKLIAAALVAKNPSAFGFSDEEFDYERPLEFDEVELTDATDLDVVARAAGVNIQDVQDLNPELKRWCTPPASTKHPYKLRLPKGAGPQFVEGFKRISPAERLTFRVHKVKRGDTLSQIAERYGTASEAILQMNRLKSARTLKLGADLVIPIPASKAAGATGGAIASKVAQARRSGVVAHRPEDEVPAGTPKGPVAAGPVKTETLNGRTRVTYGVQSGDSLWVIATKFNVSVDELKKWNNLRRRNPTLQVGSLVYVWPQGTAQVQERAGTVVVAKQVASNAGKPVSGGKVHALAEGETLWSVAQRYGVSVQDIMRWNNIKDHRTIPTGKVLSLSAP